PSDVCPKTHYCTALSDKGQPGLKVPVCAKLDNCTLLDDKAQCPTGSVCTVVRNDGGTTCVPEGTLGECDLCPDGGCSAGFVCLGPSDNRRCRKLCHAGADSECRATTRCESLPTIPKDF